MDRNCSSGYFLIKEYFVQSVTFDQPIPRWVTLFDRSFFIVNHTIISIPCLKAVKAWALQYDNLTIRL